MKANLLKIAMLSVSLLAFATATGQNNLSDEAVKVIKELKAVDTKKLSADEAQTVMKVLNLIKRENTPTPEFHQREKVQVTGFTVIKGKGDVTTEPIANEALAVKAVNQGNVLVILDGIEISEEKFKSLDPNSIEKLELRKGETMKVLYGEKAANGVLVITSTKANQDKVQVTGFTVIKGKGDVTTEPIANVDLAVKAVNQGNVLVILDGIEISEEKFKSLDPNSIEKLELRKGETMKVLYGEKAANGVIFITSVKAAAENEQRAARRANAKNVHIVTKADLKPVNREAMAKVMSCVEPMFHVRGSMARIENINSDELPVISKFKQNGNQVSFRIEVPKTENAKKQKININYTLPNM